MFEDTYKTIVNKSEGIYREKGSKFIALAYPVKTESEIKEILATLRKEYFDARHHCYAYRLGWDYSAYRINDDGEPSGTAGKPIYGQLLSNELTNILIVVIRYFGGVKLGVSGLINAYKTAAIEAISAANIITNNVQDIMDISFGYEMMNKVMAILKSDGIQIEKTEYFDETVLIRFLVSKTYSIKIGDQLSSIENSKLTFIETI